MIRIYMDLPERCSPVRAVLGGPRLRQSMSARSYCHDNAYAESCFGTIKGEALPDSGMFSSERSRSDIRLSPNLPSPPLRHRLFPRKSFLGLTVTSSHHILVFRSQCLRYTKIQNQVAMNKLCYSRWKRVQVVNLLVMSLAIPEVAAQETEMEGPVELEEMAESEELGELEEMVVVGSRHHARSVAESPVPVDVIPQDYFHSQGYSDMHTALSLMIPSYNVNVQPVSGSPSLVRPAYLRGLPGDSTLVLVNSKRRHRASVINIFGAGVTDGSHGPDLASIPAIALKQVEVLRDGSSAQYGSDAVAGVLNFVLNDAPSGSTLEARWGQYYAGDGATYTIATNIGLPLSKSGFVNLSFEYSKVDPTSRTVQRSNAQGYIDRARELEQRRSSGTPLTVEEEAEIVRGNHTPVPAQRWGVPELEIRLQILWKHRLRSERQQPILPLYQLGGTQDAARFLVSRPRGRAIFRRRGHVG